MDIFVFVIFRACVSLLNVIHSLCGLLFLHIYSYNTLWIFITFRDYPSIIIPYYSIIWRDIRFQQMFFFNIYGYDHMRFFPPLMWFIRSLFLAMFSSFRRTFESLRRRAIREREGRGVPGGTLQSSKTTRGRWGHQSSAGSRVTSWSWASWGNAVRSRASSLLEAVRLLWLMGLWFEFVLQGLTDGKLVRRVVIDKWWGLLGDP